MSEENPWKKLSSKEVYSNPWISITEFQVLNPAGNPGIYGKVHFKNYAIGIIAIDENEEITLVGQYRFPVDQYSWELPEGGAPINTDPLLSAKRELQEETGLIASKWTELMRIHLSNSVCDELSIVYVAENLSQQKAHPEETEQLQIKKVSFEKAFQMVMDGTITDAISVAAILKLKLQRSL